MSSHIFICLALAALSLCANANDNLPTLQANGVTYSNVNITSVTTTDVYFSHAHGVGNVKLKNLDPALQKRFHFNDAAARQSETNQLIANAQFHEQAKQFAATKARAAQVRATISETTVVRNAPLFNPSWTWDSKPEQRVRHAALENKPMPPLEVSGWINGAVSAADMKGKVVVLDFYATWCGPCMNAIPHNNELLRKYRDQGLIVVGICTHKRGQEVFAANAAQHQIAYPVACDSGLKAQTAWEVQYYPTYAIVDRKGIVRVVGLQPRYVETVATKLLAEPAP